MAEADHLVLAAFEGEPQEPASGEAQCLKRQRLVVEVGTDLAELQAEARAHLVFEANAFDDVALDRDADQAFPVGFRDQPMCLQARHAQPLGHFALGQASAVMQPGRADAEVVILAIPALRRDVQHSLPPDNFFFA